MERSSVRYGRTRETLIDYLYLYPEVKATDDIEALRWNAAEINNRISMKTLNSYESYINSPALSKRLNRLKTYLDVTT